MQHINLLTSSKTQARCRSTLSTSPSPLMGPCEGRRAHNVRLGTCCVGHCPHLLRSHGAAYTGQVTNTDPSHSMNSASDATTRKASVRRGFRNGWQRPFSRQDAIHAIGYLTVGLPGYKANTCRVQCPFIAHHLRD